MTICMNKVIISLILLKHPEHLARDRRIRGGKSVTGPPRFWQQHELNIFTSNVIAFLLDPQYFHINPTIFNIICKVDGTNNSWTKGLMFQGFFLHFFYRLRALKTLSLFFCKIIEKKKENKLKQFLQRILQEIMKKKYYSDHQTLG
jgi:hypothetical protein